MEMEPSLAPGAIAKPEHGTWEGHVLPGSALSLWALWMLYGNFRQYFASTRQSPFRSHSWSPVPLKRLKDFPLEPILKVVFTATGILCELWLGHVSYRRLYVPKTGRFDMGNLQDWQHSAMYAGFLASGLVDLVCHYLPLNLLGVEQGFLGLAFLVEGLLFGFHLKGSHLDYSVHLLLVMTILLGAACCFAEVRWRGSVLLSTLRCQLVLLQGVWLCQIAGILFEGKRQWDPAYHGSVMMVAPVFASWMLSIALCTFFVFAACHLHQARSAVASKSCVGVYGDEEEGWAGPLPNGGVRPEVEILGLGGRNTSHAH